MVPKELGPPGDMVPRMFRLSRGTGGCGNRGSKLVGDYLSKGTKLLGTICPWGLNLMRPFVQGVQFYGDCLSRGTGSEGPEVRGSNAMQPILAERKSNRFNFQFYNHKLHSKKTCVLNWEVQLGLSGKYC